MTISANTLVSSFGDSIAKKKGVIFCGAGVSRPSNLPLWDKILEAPRRELGLPRSFNNLPLLAQYYINNVPGGRDRLEAHIRAMLDVKSAPNQLHRLLAQMPIDEIWTTNYDDLIERSHPNACVFRQDVQIATDSKDETIAIYKMHGDLYLSQNHSSNEPSIIISRDDFASYPRRFPRMWSRLVALFATQTIFFVGLSFNDPNLAHLFSLVQNDLFESRRQHFTVMKIPTKPADIKTYKYVVSDLARFGINVVEIGNYDEITDLFRNLVFRSNPPRIYIGGSFDVSDEKLVQFCKILGSNLAEANLGVVSGASAPGRMVSYQLAETLFGLRKYQPSKILFYHRTGLNIQPSHEQRIGSVIFEGDDSSTMRARMLSLCRAAIFIGGADGTREEIKIADSLGLPVISIPIPGTASGEYWEKLIADPTRALFGATPLTVHDLHILKEIPYNAAVGARSLASRAIFG